MIIQFFPYHLMKSQLITPISSSNDLTTLSTD